MALIQINPMNYQHYLDTLGDSVQQIVDVFEAHENGGWLNALHRYNFEDMNHIDGQNQRNIFHNAIQNANNLNQRINVANEIMDWGNMLPLNENMMANLDMTLHSLDNDENLNLNNICVDRIASISKIYEMWDPAAWVIFDSYCAKGLQWLVSNMWGANNNKTHEDLLRFPWPPGRVGEPIDGFPRLGTERQARLGFIYVSWLCRAIAEILDHDQQEEWQAYHVEMVAFQIGHEV